MSGMDGPAGAAQFSRMERLRDGTPVLVRAARPDDRERIVAAFHKLDPGTIYTRFFTAKRDLNETDLSRLDRNDFKRSVVLVATLGQGADEVIIGGGAYTVIDRPGGPPTAEVSFTIEEDYQGQGLAGQLFAMLADIGRQHGIQRFEAEVLAGNAPMLKVFERSGLPLTKARDAGVTHVVMDLAPAGPEPGAAA
jgi:RimJ/RimL family protein N-acetyltransferase